MLRAGGWRAEVAALQFDWAPAEARDHVLQLFDKDCASFHRAADKLRLIERVPKIHKYPKSKTCERERDFTFSDAQYKA
jgi:integrase